MYTSTSPVDSPSASAHSLVSLRVSGQRLLPLLCLLVGLLVGGGLSQTAFAGELHPGQNFSEWDQIPMATGSNSGAALTSSRAEATTGQRSAVSSSDAKHPRLSQKRGALSMGEGPGSWIGADESDLWHALFCHIFAYIQ